MQIKERLQSFLELTPAKVGLLVTLVMCLLVLTKPYALEILELQMIDLRFKTRGPIKPGPEVVIAVVDEKSQDALGRWPWPRSIMADLINKLTEYNAFTIGFDMVFSESGEDVYNQAVQLIEQQAEAGELTPEAAAQLKKNFENQKTGDELFAESLKNHGNTILGMLFHDPEDIQHLTQDQIEKDLKTIERFSYKDYKISDPDVMVGIERRHTRPAVEANLPIFSDAAYQAGYFNLTPDDDGIMRHYPLVMKAGEHYYAPFWLHMIANYREKPNPIFFDDASGHPHVVVEDLDIPVDLQGRFLVNYYGGAQTFKHYPISDILEGKVSPNDIDSKIVLIGATGKGIFDLRATPFERVYPGVEINATILDNILQNNFLEPPPWGRFFTFTVILILGLILTPLLDRLRAGGGFFLTLGFLIGYYFINLQFFMGSPLINQAAGMFIKYDLIERAYLLNLVYPSFEIAMVYLSMTAINYFRESKQKQFIRGAFGQYLSPTVVKRLVDDPNLLKLGGDQKRMTAFFSDVAGFSGISEHLTPQQLVELLNEYLSAMEGIIERHEGIIDKYEGDAIIAFWGAPITRPDHALLACRASLEMQATLEVMRIKWREENRDELTVRIGLNTGRMVVGNMGSSNRMDYTIMGDSVNLASRLEGVNKVYGTNIMVSQFTYEDIKGELECRELDLIRVVGKAEPVAIYEVLGEKGALDENFIKGVELFHEGLARYRKKEWSKALETFYQVIDIIPGDKPSQTFIERCTEFSSAPKVARRAEDKARVLPEDWDGVFQMTSK